MFEKLYKSEYESTKELVQNPDWYLEFGRVRKARMLGLGALQAAMSGNIREAADHAKQQTLNVFEQLLEEHSVRIGDPHTDELDNQDEDRQPITQIVIHHSSRAEGLSLSALNAMHLLRLYLPVYQNKQRPVLNSTGQHQPIYSGHFDEVGEQVFYGYHWKVGQDGRVDRLLDDSALGWHAGNWEVNKRSVGICIDDDLAHKNPTEDALNAVAAIISTHYADIATSESAIIGHKEASETACPGDHFIDGWKNELVRRVTDEAA